MIKKITEISMTELEDVMTIWLAGNTETHGFIDKNYWINQFDFVKQAIQETTLVVWYEQTKIIGFLGLVDDYIAGIFVQKDHQNQGIGSKLLSVVKVENDTLSLSVYRKNHKAVTFYLKQGFKIIESRLDKLTQEEEYVMIWRQN